MFSRKGKPSFKTTILLRDYAVGGSCSVEAFEDLAQNNDYGLYLSGAKVQALGTLKSQTASFEQWRIRRSFDNVLAMLVEDQIGRDALLNEYKGYQYPLPITLRTGPFTITGEAVSEDNDPEWLKSLSYAFIPVRNAAISCEIPKGTFDDTTVDLMLVNTGVSYGYSIG